MDEKQVAAYLVNNNTDKIKFAFADIDGVLRGKIIHKQKFLDGLKSGYGFCDVVFGWDVSDALYDKPGVTGWHSGFPDKPCFIDLSTLRTVPWQEDIPFFLADFTGSSAEYFAACPRSLLKKIKAECDAMGFHAEFAQEFEWFNFKETPGSLQAKQFTGLETLTPGMFGYSVLRTSQQSGFYYDLFNLLSAFNIPLEGLHTETGPGVYEVAILHDEILKAADKAVLFKNATKEIAYKHGITASFMAKWNEKLPGCSGHIHQSLWNKEKTQNLFYQAGEPDDISNLMKSYVAGQLHCLPFLMPMYAPTVNSYKRLVDGVWAPTTVSWGIDNRTVSVRVLHPSEKYTRVEMRAPGADCNPYLSMAAALASGLYGIKNKMALEMEVTKGNAYANKDAKRLPGNLYDASIVMQSSPLAKELLGEGFVEHFIQTRLWEWKQFQQHVSDWELKRYFEIV